MLDHYLKIISALVGVILLLTGMLFITALGVGFTLYIFLRLLKEMGERIPIIELMTALASLQWILGPVIEYSSEYEHYRYKMYVDEASYMSFVVPAILVFWLGANIFKTKITLDDLKKEVDVLVEDRPYFPYILIIVGAVVPYISGFFPSSLGFAFVLLSNIKYIGAIYLIHSKHRFRWPIFWGVLLLTAVASIGAGMFHDLILWSMLVFTFLAKEWKMTIVSKFLFAFFGILFAITIQSVKIQFREATWNQDYQGNKTLLFVQMAADEWRTGTVFMPKRETDMNVRLNQGWIISAIMKNVPEYEPYAHGKTIKEGVVNSLVPRIFNPNKKIAGGRENFRKYTGLMISQSTSMGISIAGEGYANFGWVGGIIFMFLWGLFISWFWRRLEVWSKFFPTLLLWSPILFLQVVKAETEFSVVLNHLIKASVVVFGMIILIRFVWSRQAPKEDAELTTDKPT